jgi:hypothetical protein
MLIAAMDALAVLIFLLSCVGAIWLCRSARRRRAQIELASEVLRKGLDDIAVKRAVEESALNEQIRRLKRSPHKGK